MQLEKQLEKLAEFGLTLNPGVTVDDLVQGFGRESLEEPPFDSLLLVLGMETQDESLRTICSHAWNFDPECITETGDYSDIVRRLLEVAGKPSNYLGVISDSLDDAEPFLEYTPPGRERVRRPLEVNGDWADTVTLGYVMADIESDGRHFYARENGQAMGLYFLSDAAAEELFDLGGELFRVIPDEDEEEYEEEDDEE